MGQFGESRTSIKAKDSQAERMVFERHNEMKIASLKEVSTINIVRSTPEVLDLSVFKNATAHEIEELDLIIALAHNIGHQRGFADGLQRSGAVREALDLLRRLGVK